MSQPKKQGWGGGAQIALFCVMLPNSTDDWLKAITEGDTIFSNQNDLLSRTKVLGLTKKTGCRNTHSWKFIPRHLREMRE